jgi:hypothetical protein
MSDDDAIMPFGKHKGERLAMVDPWYLVWLTCQGNVRRSHPKLYARVCRRAGKFLLERAADMEPAERDPNRPRFQVLSEDQLP